MSTSRTRPPLATSQRRRPGARERARLSLAIEARASAIHGQGVFALCPIARETLVGAYEGERTTEDGTHVLWVEYDDGELVGIDGKNALRFLNHSSTPNAYFWGHQLFALRDIAAGEELTFDYGEDWAEQR